MACDQRQQAEFGLGDNADEEIVHICTRKSSHGGRHHDHYTNHAWERGAT